MSECIFANKIRDLVDSSLESQLDFFLWRDINTNSLPPLDLNNPDFEQYGLTSSDFVDISRLNLLFVFKDSNKNPCVLIRQLPFSLQETARTLKIDERGTVDFNVLKKAISNNKQKQADLEKLNPIPAVWHNDTPCAQVQAVKYLSKELKAAWAAIFTLKKYYLPEIDSDSTFKELTEEMKLVRDYIVSCVLEMNQKKFLNFGLGSLKFKDRKALLKAAKTYFFNQTPIGYEDKKTGTALMARIGRGASEYSLVQLLTPKALDFESSQLNHCVGHGSYDEKLENEEIYIFSLRDKMGKPHATLEVDSHTKEIIQIRGHGNKEVLYKYQPPLLELLSDFNNRNDNNIHLNKDLFYRFPSVILNGKQKSLFALTDTEMEHLIKNREIEITPDCYRKFLDNVLEGTKVTDTTMSHLILQQPFLLAQLREFNLSGTTVFPYELKNLKILSRLKLKLTDNRFGYKEAKILSKATGLTSVDLRNNSIGVAGANALAENKTLTELDISCNNVENEGLFAFATNTTLKKLNISENRIGNKGAVDLAACNSLEFLDISHNRVNDEGIIALAQNKSLKCLILDKNFVSLRGFKALGKNTTLTQLSLNWICFEEISAKLLAENFNLSHLTVKFSEITSSVLTELTKNKNLTFLDVSFNDITDAAVPDLINNKTLTHLIINDNPLTTEGIEKLSENKTLTELDIGFNPFWASKKIQNAFEKNLENNFNLLELHGIKNQKIDNFLARNKQEASHILNKLLSNQIVPLNEVSKRQNAILTLALKEVPPERQKQVKNRVLLAIQQNTEKNNLQLIEQKKSSSHCR